MGDMVMLVCQFCDNTYAKGFKRGGRKNKCDTCASRHLKSKKGLVKSEKSYNSFTREQTQQVLQSRKDAQAKNQRLSSLLRKSSVASTGLNWKTLCVLYYLVTITAYQYLKEEKLGSSM